MLHAPNYKALWDAKASTTQGALLAVDGSTNEDVLRMTGAYSARQVEAALDLHAGDRVLELGCGVGRIGRELAPSIAHWEGSDISGNMRAPGTTSGSSAPNNRSFGNARGCVITASYSWAIAAW